MKRTLLASLLWLRDWLSLMWQRLPSHPRGIRSHLLLRFICPLVLAWFFYLLLNGWFTLYSFRHLSRFRAASVSDYMRWYKAGRASSRPITNTQAKPEQGQYQFLEDMRVTNLSAQASLTKRDKQNLDYLAQQGWYNNVRNQLNNSGAATPTTLMWDSDEWQDPPVETSVLTILYFPPKKAEYAFALEIRQEDGSGGWGLQARYLLFHLTELNRPYVSPQHPSIDILTRENGWFGLRPTALWTTEEQLAARFFLELDILAKGAGEKVPLKPSTTEIEERQRFIHRVLLEKLGRGEKPDQFDQPIKPMSEWIEWVRRFNGGSWWGLIQFTVVVLVFAFLIDALIIGRLLFRVDAILNSDTPGTLRLGAAPAAEGMCLPQEITDPLRLIDDSSRTLGVRLEALKLLRLVLDRRLSFLRLLTGALPLIGFLGSVAGLSISLIGSTGISSPDAIARQDALQRMQIALGTAFDKSMLAFAGSIFCLIGLSWLNSRLDALEAQARRLLGAVPRSSEVDLGGQRNGTPAEHKASQSG